MVFTRGYDRLVNLSDAVIAIAVTLLILPLVDKAGDIGSTSPGDFLEANMGGLLLFGLSFVVIARFWLLHHQIYRVIDGYTLPLVWVNFAWLLSIVFLPFPTELLGQGNHVSTGAGALYIGTMLVTSVTGLIQLVMISRRPEMQLESVRGTLHLTPAVVATCAMAAAFALSFAVGLYSLLLLLLSGLVEGQISRRQKARAVAASPSGPAGASPVSPDTRP
ncbi:MAG: potassium channel family protein [Subtercola sp.]|nr:potassium channel family protein [Subtercola sp.]